MRKILFCILILCFQFIFNNSTIAKNEINQTNINENLENTRTIRDFNYFENIFSISDKWAKENGYHIIPSTAQNIRIYKNNNRYLMAPVFCLIEQNSEKIHMEGWVKVPLIIRIANFFIPPPEVNLDSTELGGCLPRAVGRRTINKLMAELNQEPLERGEKPGELYVETKPPDSENGRMWMEYYKFPIK